MAAERTTFPAGGLDALEVRVARGRVTVEAREDLPEVTVTLAPRSGQARALERMTVERRGDRLVVNGPEKDTLIDMLGSLARDREFVVDVSVLVPTGARLALTCGRGEISVDGPCGPADVTSGSGGVTLDHVAGDARLRVGHGEVRIGTVDGSLHVRTGNGALDAQSVGGELDAELGRGDLSVATTSGRVHIRTGYGKVLLSAVFGDVDAATGFGGIILGVPLGVSAHVDASTGFGRVRSEAPVESVARAGTRAVRVRARTGFGDITLERNAPAAA